MAKYDYLIVGAGLYGAVRGERNGVRYHQVSCDGLDFKVYLLHRVNSHRSNVRHRLRKNFTAGADCANIRFAKANCGIYTVSINS